MSMYLSATPNFSNTSNKKVHEILSYALEKSNFKNITSCFECLAQSKFLARGGHFPSYGAKGGK
jgi:hypothetical protein